jgi:hypothetical protein
LLKPGTTPLINEIFAQPFAKLATQCNKFEKLIEDTLDLKAAEKDNEYVIRYDVMMTSDILELILIRNCKNYMILRQS